jgi:hypothetical protein
MSKLNCCTTAFLGAVLLTFSAIGQSPQDSSTNLYWGDTHIHTALSADAYTMGTRVTPDLAYRFAKGEAITSSTGQEAKLKRPLDFVLVSDHAENLGMMPRLADGDSYLLGRDFGKDLAQRLKENQAYLDEIGSAADNAEFLDLTRNIMAAKNDWKRQYGLSPKFRQTVWNEIVENAERHNAPGTFTAFIGFEWSGDVMLHRNVIFKGDSKHTRDLIPYSNRDSQNVEDLWAYLNDYEQNAAAQVLAIPHNANLARGRMFATTDYNDKLFTESYAKTRARWEPLTEVTQTKGDSETHPLVSPDDEFAGFESWGAGASKAGGLESINGAYARPALIQGLNQQVVLGVNPFKFGMIGSTDSHTGLSTGLEDNYWGGYGAAEPNPFRAKIHARDNAAGYAGIWAEENTRESLFNAMMRKETYATTGPRITVRFFGGWNFEESDAKLQDLAAVGYKQGVPMGGDLTSAPNDASPTFLIRAAKDPVGANLDRVQIIKGWRDSEGGLHEKVYNAALSDNRQTDSDGTTQPVGTTVDIKNASYTNTIGDPEFSITWKDPHFDKDQLAFYYVRVIEIPTPRWPAYDAKRYGITDLPRGTLMVTQERAYTSPIWYTP